MGFKMAYRLSKLVASLLSNGQNNWPTHYISPPFSHRGWHLLIISSLKKSLTHGFPSSSNFCIGGSVKSATPNAGKLIDINDSFSWRRRSNSALRKHIFFSTSRNDSSKPGNVSNQWENGGKYQKLP